MSGYQDSSFKGKSSIGKEVIPTLGAHPLEVFLHQAIFCKVLGKSEQGVNEEEAVGTFKGKLKKAMVVSLAALLALVFLVAGGSKLVNPESAVESFQDSWRRGRDCPGSFLCRRSAAGSRMAYTSFS